MSMFIDALKRSVENITELEKLSVWIGGNPEQVEQVVEEYKSVLGRLGDVTDDDIEVINKSRRCMSENAIRLHSASSLETHTFLVALGQASSRLNSEAIRALDYGSQECEMALDRMTAMMKRGSEIAVNPSVKPIDGDSVWDTVIWGHTQARDDVNPRVLLYFVVAHYLCQYMNIVLGEDFDLKDKDDFINVLADLILLQYAQYGESGLFVAWVTAKKDGGLGWVDQYQASIYEDMLK